MEMKISISYFPFSAPQDATRRPGTRASIPVAPSLCHPRPGGVVARESLATSPALPLSCRGRVAADTPFGQTEESGAVSEAPAAKPCEWRARWAPQMDRMPSVWSKSDHEGPRTGLSCQERVAADTLLLK